MQSLDLTSFPSIDAQTWRTHVEKELKDKSWQDLIWSPEESLSLEAGYHPDDKVSAHFLPNIANGNWLIGENFVVNGDPTSSNVHLMEALNMGLESPGFTLSSQVDLDGLLNGVMVNYLDTVWHLHNANILEDILKALEQHAESNSRVHGGFIWKYALGSDFLEQYATIIDYKKTYPACSGMRFIPISPEPNKGIIESVAQVIAAVNAVIQSLLDRGFIGADILGSLQINLSVSDHIMLNIAKIRAVRLCLLNLVKAHRLDPIQPIFLNVQTDEKAYSIEDNYNRIKAALMGWSAAVGGADRIALHPGGLSESSFDRRIARNIQHLLKMESLIGQVADPLQGSYYIEAATSQIAASAWNRFKEINHSGDYYEGKSMVF